MHNYIQDKNTFSNPPKDKLIKRLVKNFVYKAIALYPYLNIQQKLTRILEQAIPQHGYLSFQNELSAALHSAKSKTVPKQYDKAKGLLVNLGAGTYGKLGWVNVDISPAPGINCVYDCRKSLPFPNESVKGIFSEHFFEHIDYVEEVPDFLSECYRVLEVGGVIRIIVPDAEQYLFAYCKEG